MIKEIMITNAFGEERQPDGTYVDMLDGYDGCQLQCPYCFQMNNKEWSKDILVRTNIADILEKQIKNGKSRKKMGDLFIGSLSDPYMPMEEKYQLTRSMLEVLCDKDYDVKYIHGWKRIILNTWNNIINFYLRRMKAIIWRL